MSRILLSLAFFAAAFAATAENVLWIESENTMGVHRSKGIEAGEDSDRIIPVPWTALWSVGTNAAQQMSVSNLVLDTGLVQGADRMKYFDGPDQVFKVWLRGTSTWGYLEDAHWKSSQAGETLDAETTRLARGQALWLRATGGGDVYLIGQSSTNAPVSVMAADNPYNAEAQLFTESFTVNPCDTDVDLVGMVFNAVAGDQINVVTPTGSVLYWYRVPTGGGDAAWCTLGMTKETVTTPWGASVEVEKLGYVKSETLPVPYGAGVWYSCVTNALHSPPPEIRWRHQEEFRQ